MTRPTKTSTLATIAPPPEAIAQAVKWVIAGRTERDIREAIAATWPLTEATPLIVAALQEISSAAKANPDLVRGFAIEGTREIYRKALEVGDHQTALRALKQLTELTK